MKIRTGNTTGMSNRSGLRHLEAPEATGRPEEQITAVASELVFRAFADSQTPMRITRRWVTAQQEDSL